MGNETTNAKGIEMKTVKSQMNWFIRKLGNKTISAVWKEYKEEAENQDGKGYWKLFGDVSDLFADFMTYLQEVDSDCVFITDSLMDELAQEFETYIAE